MHVFARDCQDNRRKAGRFDVLGEDILGTFSRAQVSAETSGATVATPVKDSPNSVKSKSVATMTRRPLPMASTTEMS